MSREPQAPPGPPARDGEVFVVDPTDLYGEHNGGPHGGIIKPGKIEVVTTPSSPEGQPGGEGEDGQEQPDEEVRAGCFQSTTEIGERLSKWLKCEFEDLEEGRFVEGEFCRHFVVDHKHPGDCKYIVVARKVGDKTRVVAYNRETGTLYMELNHLCGMDPVEDGQAKLADDHIEIDDHDQ